MNKRFNRVNINLNGKGITGDIVTSIRPEPVKQTSFAEVRGLIGDLNLKGHRALIVGGSRGLGEVCAKVVSAAGADVLLTYAAGAQEAEDVAAEIRNAGANAITERLDVISIKETNLEKIKQFKPTQMYYWATPKINITNSAIFREELFEKYSNIYLYGFFNLINSLQSHENDILNIFYPSTTLIDEPMAGVVEYAAAKSAGESCCHTIEVVHKHINCTVCRLPKIRTDQTATLFGNDGADPLTEMIAIVRKTANVESASQ